MTARRVLYVVRHGETDWNAAERWQGHTDIPLNANGRVQAKAVAQVLVQAGNVTRSRSLSGVVTSDLSRAVETASIIASELGLAVAYADAGLRERAFGCFEGLTRAECAALHPRAWQDWLAERRAPQGAETHEVLTARIVEAMRRAAERVARHDAPAIVVTHGGALRALVAAATGRLPAPIRNGALWRVTWHDGPVSAEEV